MSHRLDVVANEDLLLECVRARRNLSVIRELLERSDFDWDTFWSYAQSQQVWPLVAKVLSDPALTDALPAAAQQDVKAARIQTTISNMALHAELKTIANLLRQHGIPIIPLKGTQLAQRLFDSLDARRCGDIDILVSEQNWDAANEILLASGYQPAEGVRPGVERHTFHGVPLLRYANGQFFKVEIHRQLTDPRFVTIDHRAIWERARIADSQPDQTVDLPAEELLVFLAIHAPKHCDGVLRLLADIDHLIAREGDLMDWNRVAQLARRWHADSILYFVLTLSGSLLTTNVPAEMMRSIQPPNWKRVLVSSLVGPHVILRPPVPLHLRANRSKIAYCLMLRRGGRMLRSYWHYIMMPPRTSSENPLASAKLTIRRPVDGLAWTALALGSAMRDRVRVGSPARP